MEEVAHDEQPVPDARGLGCEDPAGELPDGRRQHELTIKRVMTDEEWAAAQEVNGLLSSLVNTSYNRLMSRIEFFFAGIEEVLKVLNRREARSPDPPLRERFSEALFALRTFQDHMPHDLRKLFGGDRAAAADVFQAACSTEYDRSFEYRLGHNLRNQAQHKQDVIEVKYHVSVVPPDGVERRVDTIVSEGLLDQAISGGGKWQARVREELKTRDRPIRADQLLRSLQVSAARIMASTMVARRDEIERAIAEVRKLATEADCTGHPALMHYGPPPQERPPGLGRQHRSPIFRSKHVTYLRRRWRTQTACCGQPSRCR